MRTCGGVALAFVALSCGVVACVGDAPADGGDATTDGGSVAHCTDPGAPVCTHGKCDDGSGVAKCACDPGFTGATCSDACPDGGTCSTSAPSCATTTCQPHALCTDSASGPTCACATGYQGTTTCTWAGAPLDPGFQNTPASSWTTIDGPVLEPTAAGSVEPGDVHFDHTTVCTSEGRVKQTIQMPPYAVAEPLALNITGRMTCSSSDQGCAEENGNDRHTLGVAFNGGYEKIPTTDAYSGAIMCLGERAYGGPVEIVLAADGDGCFDGSLTYDALIDHADIEPTPACPAPGAVINFDFEGTNGWATTPNGGTSEIANGFGVAGSRGGHLHSDNWGQAPQISEVLSLYGDASQPNDALSVSFNGNNDALQVTVDGQDIGELVATGGQQTAHLCVPDWAKGLVHQVSFQFDFRNDSLNGSNYIENRDFGIDNFAWVTDPTCPASAAIADSGFERNDPGRGWVLQASQGFVNATTAVIATDATAHGGTKSLHLGVQSGCQTAVAMATFAVPPSTASAGPAVSFWYKGPSAGGLLRYTAATSTGTVAGSTLTWTQKIVCVDPKLAGRGASVIFKESSSGSTVCTTTFPQADAFIDDVTPTTDPSCPR